MCGKAPESIWLFYACANQIPSRHNVALHILVFETLGDLGLADSVPPGGGGWFREEETLCGERKIAFGMDAEECDIQLSQPHI